MVHSGYYIYILYLYKYIYNIKYIIFYGQVKKEVNVVQQTQDRKQLSKMIKYDLHIQIFRCGLVCNKHFCAFINGHYWNQKAKQKKLLFVLKNVFWKKEEKKIRKKWKWENGSFLSWGVIDGSISISSCSYDNTHDDLYPGANQTILSWIFQLYFVFMSAVSVRIV